MYLPSHPPVLLSILTSAERCAAFRDPDIRSSLKLSAFGHLEAFQFPLTLTYYQVFSLFGRHIPFLSTSSVKCVVL